MKLSQKRTCFGCKALQSKGCELGYETGTMASDPNEQVPVEPCPKPMTQKDINTARTELRKGAILGTWLKDKLIILTFAHSDLLLLERGMRLLRYNSIEAFNEYKQDMPHADELIKRLQEAIEQN